MTKNRLEAFSDGVIAILITIMVLRFTVPHGDQLGALWQLRFVFVSYVLSFVYLAIYWNNHHHMLSVTGRVTGGVLWANMHLLFWLSLVPFATSWMGEHSVDHVPTAVYGVVLLMAAIAYFILQRTIIRSQGEKSLLAEAVGRDLKGKASPILYAIAIAMAFVQPWVAYGIYVLVALMWIIPDRRIEDAVVEREAAGEVHDPVGEARETALAAQDEG
ncbi:MAG TPA: TMEM175 family protein [Thermoleophilia bacterium]